MPYFQHQGCNLYYQQSGAGQPLVLVHGLGSSCKDWEYQIPALSQHYHVICLDVRGHGRSDKPRQRYRMADFAGDVLALLDHLALPQVHLLGISMGGMIGFELGVHHPERLLSLIIVNSAPEVRAHNIKDHLEIFKRRLIARILPLSSLAQALGKLLFPHPEQQELREKIAQRWPRNDKRAYMASLNAIIGWSVAEQLYRISCPVLVISADRDYTPVELKREYVAKLPKAKLLVIEHSRHATPLDQPDVFNQAVLNFLNETAQEDNTHHA